MKQNTGKPFIVVVTTVVIIVVAIIAIVVNTSKRKRSGGDAGAFNAATAPQQEERLPDVPVAVDTTNIALKAVVNERRKTVRATSMPDSAQTTEAVRCVVGQDPATANRYLTRSRAIESLGKELSDSDTALLLAYLGAEDTHLRRERVAALKNDVMNLLRAQTTISPELAPRLIAIFNAKQQDSAVLDYSIQHLGMLQTQIADAAQRELVYACLRDAARGDAASYSGTALIAMNHRKNPSDDDRAFLKERATAIVSNPKSHEASRITAIQIASENGYAEILPTLRAIAASGTDSVSLRIVAVGALGCLGDASDKEMLADLLNTAPNLRLVPALNAALSNNHE